MLGVSRQHVVDLCDSGRLRHVRVGTHRRVLASEVERFLGRGVGLTREQERSLWLHRAVTAEIVCDPQRSLDLARDNLGAWMQEHSAGRALGVLEEWRNLLDRGVDAVLETLASTAPGACELRQNSPFAGLLDDDRRLEVLRSFNSHWQREHANDAA